MTDTTNSMRMECGCGWATAISGSITHEERAEIIAYRVQQHLLTDYRHAPDRQAP